ncbi:hypothetical protein [Jiella avicenniae]|uniref:Alpha/beta hydrolase n=1 Tax=Jiella avicenniae TaxID=2907202 RepID=A0A9X1P116_9HYPH|nr:hypothetical protein [Jiella avicenniae]MCE7027829.1 hypothetical protein [Jiella avicenniae]
MTETSETARGVEAQGANFRRHVFYIHGFDPRGAPVYHGHFRAGLKAASARWSRDIAVVESEAEALAAGAWTVTSRGAKAGTRVETRYEMLAWTDIVGRYWFPRKQLRLAAESFRFAWTTWRRGILRRFYRPAWALFVAILMTPALLVLWGLVTVVAIAAGAALAMALGTAFGAPPWAAIAAALAVALLVLAGLSMGWNRLKAWLNVWWVTRFLGYLRGCADGRFDRSEERADAFAERMFEVWRAGKVDEILVVGHSLGAIFLVRAGARLLRLLPEGEGGPTIVLLTLGHTVPLYTLLGGDAEFRRDLAVIATTDRLRLLDVTSGSDPGSSCRIPLVEGIDLGERPSRVISREPDFHDILEPETFRRIRMRPLEFHFQYLKPSERGHGFDYFELVTRPRPIETSVAVP